MDKTIIWRGLVILVIAIVGVFYFTTLVASNNPIQVKNINSDVNKPIVNPTPTPTPVPTPTPTPTPSTPSYTAAQVATHSSSKDCWMIVDNKVYDATTYINSHPGGSAILQGCGGDATSMFASIHSSRAYNILDAYFIGNLK